MEEVNASRLPFRLAFGMYEPFWDMYFILIIV